jgi:DNA-binding IclR family transcriptional regulator
MPENSHKVHAVEKAIALLDCFWREKRPMTLTELSKSTGWPKSTVHNLLASMMDSAVVEQSPADGKYRLGLHLFEYGCVISEHWNVVKLARPHLNALVAKTGESAYLASLNADTLLIVDSAEPNNVFRVASTVGTRLPVHCTSQGKAILAHMDAAGVRRLLKRAGMKSYTVDTLKSPEAFLEQMNEIRQSGVASEYEEYHNGMCSFASPVFDYEGTCISAVGIVCFLHSGDRRNAVSQETLQALKNTAEAISTELGWHG